MAKTRKKTNYGVLFWIASILLLCALYIANHKNIQRVLDSTRFMEVVFETDEIAPTPEAPERIEVREPDEASPESGQADETVVVVAPDETATEEPIEPTEVIPETEETPLMTATLYFIRVSDDGRIMPEAVERPVAVGDSPLTRTIESLVNGPNVDAVNRGLLNLVPEGTRLLSASVDGGVAYLNFSEEFRFNPLGTEGSLAQLQQVVYSATAFSSIDRVQILVEGEVLEYLSVEGIYIGAPLSRETFRA